MVRHNEGFTRAYDLPNQTAYAETCAAIALVFFAHRMVQIEADAHYADTMELALYNGVLSGVSHDGERFFYVNPLASAGQHHRQEWFGCACCPPNVARLIASIGQYACSAAAKALYVHLYAAGSASAEVAARKVTLTQRTDYPWAGEVAITVDVDQPATFDLMLRIPGWCRKHTVALDGRKVAAPIAKGYARIRRRWTGGETVTLSLAMPVERMVAHPSVAEDAGKVALQRGPIVFCLEGCDHAVDVRSIRLPDRAKLTARFDPKLLGGATVIEAAALAPATAGWKGKLYRPAGEQALRPVKIKAIPYHLWDNRKPGPMTVWLARA